MPAKTTDAREDDAVALVRTFLETLGRRDRVAAQAFLGEGCVMVFPGEAKFTTMDELAENAATRYRKVNKRFERFESFAAEKGTVVYVSGRLYGEWPDGTPFDNIRFIDRFLIAGGKIREQDVWNDLEVLRPR